LAHNNWDRKHRQLPHPRIHEKRQQLAVITQSIPITFPTSTWTQNNHELFTSAQEEEEEEEEDYREFKI
jgi:hypothetical protein